MKLVPFNKNISNVNRPPLKTCLEMAHEFGISIQKLTSICMTDNNAPKLRFKTGTSKSQKKTWCEADKMRAWWKNRSQGEIK